MSHFNFSRRSLDTLGTVHPDLQKVVKEALKLTTVDFMVGQGLRTKYDQMRLYGQGRTGAELARAGIPAVYAKPQMQKVTWTMKSNHMTGRAVDLWAWVDGKISWDTSKGYYQVIAHAMKEAARIHGVRIAWGGDWVRTKDYPHFELI